MSAQPPLVPGMPYCWLFMLLHMPHYEATLKPKRALQTAQRAQMPGADWVMYSLDFGRVQ